MSAVPRALRPDLRVTDAAVVGVLLVSIGLQALGSSVASARSATELAAGVAAGALQTVPVLWRRRHPVPALLAFSVTVPPVLDLLGTVPVLVWAVLAFGVARRTDAVRATVVVVASVLVTSGIAAWVAARDPGAALVVLAAVAWPFPLVGAVAAAVARARAARAERRHAERERARLAAALAEQRDRLSGELGGLVAGRLERLVRFTAALPADPSAVPTDRLDRDLVGVAEEARGALAGMRGALGLLREDDPPELPEAGWPTGSSPGPAVGRPPGSPEVPAELPTGSRSGAPEGLVGPPSGRPSGSATGPAAGGGARRWLPDHVGPTGDGLALAALLAAVTVVVAVATASRPGAGSPSDLFDVDPTRPAALLVLLVQVATLGWWRSAPVPALVVATVGSLLGTALGSTNGVAELGWTLLVFGAGAGATVLVSGAAVAVCALSVLLATLLSRVPAVVDAPSPLLSIVLSYILVPAVWGLGVARTRSVLAADRQRAEREARAAEQAVRAQRLGLARELHDVLAHELSALVVQVNAARVAPDAAGVAGVRAGGERIAGALPALLAVNPAARAPAGGWDREALDELVAPSRAAGLPVVVDVEGAPAPGAPETDLFAGRIVTEALTNVLRHAGPAPTRVVVRHEEGAVVLAVDDEGPRDGHRPPSTGSGLGLRGMRERAALLGGSLDAGPRPRGWSVRASLPHGVLRLEEEAPRRISSSLRTPAPGAAP